MQIYLNIYTNKPEIQKHINYNLSAIYKERFKKKKDQKVWRSMIEHINSKWFNQITVNFESIFS